MDRECGSQLILSGIFTFSLGDDVSTLPLEMMYLLSIGVLHQHCYVAHTLLP
jgi:hypothetical protein